MRTAIGLALRVTAELLDRARPDIADARWQVLIEELEAAAARFL